MNYGISYLSFTTFGSMACSRYGGTFTMMISIILNTLSLILMSIFSAYSLWLIVIFVEGVSFALFTISSTHFVTSNISIHLRKPFESIMTVISRISMVMGCVSVGNLIQIDIDTDHSTDSTVTALIFMAVISGMGLIAICVLTVPPKYNEKGQRSLVSNHSGGNSRGSITSWKLSYKQLSLRQRLNLFSWIRSDIHSDSEAGSVTFGEDELNTLAVVKRNISTLTSILMFSFGLTFMRCSRLLMVTFQCMAISATPQQIGTINALGFVPEIVLCLIGERILYRFGRRFTLIPCYLLMISALLALPFCNDIPSISWTALLMGIGNGIGHGLIHKVAVDVSPTEFRDKFLNICQSLTRCAYIVAPILVALWCDGFGMKTTGICVAVIGLISLLWSW